MVYVLKEKNKNTKKCKEMIRKLAKADKQIIEARVLYVKEMVKLRAKQKKDRIKLIKQKSYYLERKRLKDIENKNIKSSLYGLEQPEYPTDEEKIINGLKERLKNKGCGLSCRISQLTQEVLICGNHYNKLGCVFLCDDCLKIDKEGLKNG